ncbi:hypothetical protein HPB48_026946 [Haemaphysalis longicornis]|uniref:Uncharacterized protein n=1 Tax=Haemaphysalis longicornis TaxID=44386 RepID=A0A9J6HC15_HAELO|nr:hypothetical protein HPB48_026946 [Haemaphysalis longicornis]
MPAVAPAYNSGTAFSSEEFFKGSLFLVACCWPNGHCGAVTSPPCGSLSLAAYRNGPALSVFRENGYYGFPPKSLAAHGTTVLSVAVSPWTNAVASCDASGEVGAIVLPCLSQSLDLMKHHNHSRLPLYRTLLVALNENEEDGQRQPAGKKRPLARPGPPQHGGHVVASRDFGLCFEDVPLLRDGPVPQQALERVVNFKGMLSRTSNQYRLASLNTVSLLSSSLSPSLLLSLVSVETLQGKKE